jgi:hypothetical protein
MINGFAFVATVTSDAIKGMQSGRLQTYVLFFFGGVLVISILLIANFIGF